MLVCKGQSQRRRVSIALLLSHTASSSIVCVDTGRRPRHLFFEIGALVRICLAQFARCFDFIDLDVVSRCACTC